MFSLRLLNACLLTAGLVCAADSDAVKQGAARVEQRFAKVPEALRPAFRKLAAEALQQRYPDLAGQFSDPAAAPAPLRAATPRTPPSAEAAAIQKSMGQIRALATDAERGNVVIKLAADIRALPAGREKLGLASSLSNLATEGDLGKEALNSVTAALAQALHETEGAAGNYIELAKLVRYEHVTPPPADPALDAATAVLELRDQVLQETGFTLTALDGKVYSLNALRGHVVLLNFWATWGRPCALDVGLRFYHQTPQIDVNNTFVNFNPDKYSKSAISRIYVPACSTGAATCTSGANGLVAKDPLTGATTSNGSVGSFVPNSGDPTSGMQVLRVNGAPGALYHQSPLVLAPRLGFAYDVMGDGKTAIRGGFGMFYNRLDGNQVYSSSGQSPIAYQVSVSNVTFAQIAAQNTGAPPSLASMSTAPNSPTIWLPTEVPWDKVMNASLDVQRSIGASTVITIGARWNRGYDQHLTYNPNWIPIGTGWPFTPSNRNPTTAGNTSADIGSIFERNVYPGYGGMTSSGFQGESIYNALTATMSRRLSHGLAVGAAYTFSKGLGTTTYTPAVASNKAWNYGRVSGDRPQNLQINYTYDIPGLGKRLGVKALGALKIGRAH